MSSWSKYGLDMVKIAFRERTTVRTTKREPPNKGRLSSDVDRFQVRLKLASAFIRIAFGVAEGYIVHR